MNEYERDKAFEEELEKAYRTIYRKLYMKNYYATKQNELKKKSLLNYHKNKNNAELPAPKGLQITRKNLILDFNINTFHKNE